MLVYTIVSLSAMVLCEISSADYRLIRAARSFAYNKQYLPVISDRLERAEDKIRTYLLMAGLSEKDIGPLSVEMDCEGDISVTFNTLDGWEQLSIPTEDFTRELKEASPAYSSLFNIAVQSVDSLMMALNCYADGQLDLSLLDKIVGRCDSLTYDMMTDSRSVPSAHGEFSFGDDSEERPLRYASVNKRCLDD